MTPHRFQKLGGEVTDHFRKLTDDRFSELFALGAVELKERAVMLENQLVHCTASRDRFKEGTSTHRVLDPSSFLF